MLGFSFSWPYYCNSCLAGVVERFQEWSVCRHHCGSTQVDGSGLAPVGHRWLTPGLWDVAVVWDYIPRDALWQGSPDGVASLYARRRDHGTTQAMSYQEVLTEMTTWKPGTPR